MNTKWKQILEKYGRLAIVIYLTTFVVTFAGVFLLIQVGFQESIVSFFQEYLGEEYSSAGTLVVTYAITKILQPIRIAITIALIPIFGREKPST